MAVKLTDIYIADKEVFYHVGRNLKLRRSHIARCRFVIIERNDEFVIGCNVKILLSVNCVQFRIFFF